MMGHCVRSRRNTVRRDNQATIPIRKASSQLTPPTRAQGACLQRQLAESLTDADC
jgi:hypothetical protein